MSDDQAPLNPIPTHLPIVPEFAQAALRDGHEYALVTAAVLRARDERGQGHLAHTAAVDALTLVRQIGARQASRLLAAGRGRYYEIDDTGEVWLWRLSRVAQVLGVGRVGRARLVPISSFQGSRTALRAALYSTVFHTDAEGSPITRRLLSELTGVPRATQQRYERWVGVQTVAEVHVELVHVDRRVRGLAVDAFQHWGVYQGRAGALMRRHGNIRATPTHKSGSGAVAARINRELASSDSPVPQARGERPLRAYFRATPGAKTPAATAWLRHKHALGKPPVTDRLHHDFLNYAAIARVSRRGRVLWMSAREPP